MPDWPDHVKEIVRLALAEDIGSGDITTNAIYSGKEMGTARLIARRNGVLAGIELASYILHRVNPQVMFNPKVRDGQQIMEGTELALLKGPLAPVLSAERTMLNFLQRMSGIATRTRAFAKVLESTRSKILDTRKTVPGHRYLDKMAVRIGGGVNHRMRLDDRFLIKENHIRMAGGIEKAISHCIAYREKYNLKVAIEIEVTELDELDCVVTFGQVDYVMLDNMSLANIKKAVDRVQNKYYTEASGNITLENLLDIANTGVDFISSGALTHSVPALDISLLVDEG
ncbi:MAG: carboxylating nicotinate-nucleotide diphosphorylase [Balneolales bacterium]